MTELRGEFGFISRTILFPLYYVIHEETHPGLSSEKVNAQGVLSLARAFKSPGGLAPL